MNQLTPEQLDMINTWKEYLCWKAWRYSLDQELIAFMLNDWSGYEKTNHVQNAEIYLHLR